MAFVTFDRIAHYVIGAIVALAISIQCIGR